ncbi:M12 family metallo-peptidase [Nocardioides hwasunensis]|uniref:Peptidase M12B domain-containing protein n=1 Tax=Nocardioides hwasunensis TaxID=397258 RepID=A0ABR8MGV6_9ACTN|nr:M12 family metallo-peptidase [Nocardioides hwasunensis]MBD3915203.1 hypothetical protein [Nocardioides hwasunensis]
MSMLMSAPRLAGILAAALSLAVAAPASSMTGVPTAAGKAGASAASATARALLTEVAGTGLGQTRPRGIVGDHVRVRLHAGALPSRAQGQRLTLPLAGRVGHVRIDTVDHDGDQIAWAGALDGDRLSSFSLVRAGGVYRGSLISPAGIYSLTQTDDGGYWWSEVEPRRGAEGADTITASHLGHDERPAARRDAAPRERRAARKAKINVLFAYTRAARAEAGGKAQLKAAAALVVSQTNETFRNSGLRVTVRYQGLVKAAGKESADAITNLNRLFKPRDGRFDNLHRARGKHRADLVHLFTTGSQYDVCGAGNLPLSVRQTHPALAFSTSFYSCMPYLVATHEIGHNLGADHIGYEGVSHDSKIPYSYAFYNVAGGYLTVMGYYAPCEDAQVYTCVRLPWFSSPTTTYNGQPLGVGAVTDNAKVVRKIAPRVARYRR